MPGHLTAKCWCSGWVTAAHALRSPHHSSYAHLQGSTAPAQSVCPGLLSREMEQRVASVCQLSVAEGAEMLRGSLQSHPSGSVDIPPHLQCRCAQCLLPWSSWFQPLECDSLNPTCFHAHFLLSPCTAAFGCQKVTPCQLCSSCSDPGPRLPAPQHHHLSQLPLAATFPHLTAFVTACPPKSSSHPSTFTLSGHS